MKTALCLAIALTATGCTHRVWFTQPLREGLEAPSPGEPGGEAGLGEPSRAPDDLQYFASERIVLERELRSRSEALTRGRVLVRRGRTIEQVIVRRGTPGVAVEWGPDWVAVSFEKGTSLVFELVDDADDAPGIDRPPDSFAGERLPASYYRLRTEPGTSGEPTVSFEGRSFVAVHGAARARLQIERTAWTRYRKHRRVLEGVRVK